MSYVTEAEPDVCFAQGARPGEQPMTWGPRVSGWLPSFQDEASLLLLLPLVPNPSLVWCVGRKAAFFSFLPGLFLRGLQGGPAPSGGHS